MENAVQPVVEAQGHVVQLSHAQQSMEVIAQDLKLCLATQIIALVSY